MKTIVVPTDFSPASVNALEFAVNMALDIDARVLIVHYYSIPLAYSEVPLLLVSMKEAKQASESKLEALRQKMTETTGGKVTIRTAATLGNTIDELEALCKRVQPFAVVMGATGKSALENVVFGSTALLAIRHLTCPVITVPQGSTYDKGIQKIGFACDYKEIAETTPIRLIREMVWEFDAELYVLYVDHNQRNFRPETAGQTFLLHDMLKDLHPEYRYIENKDVDDGISGFAMANNLDLVIAIPKKHKLLQGIFKPSSTKQLVFHSQVPVMCMHEE